MTRYDYAKRIVDKTRRLLRDEEGIKEVINFHPGILINDKFNIQSLTWALGDIIITVTDKEIVYHNKGKSKTLYTYNSFDELLSL